MSNGIRHKLDTKFCIDHFDRLGCQLWHRSFTKGKLAISTGDHNVGGGGGRV